ncbi:MAG: ABC transporter permease, partial [Planctomycetota bacterium]
DTPASVQSVARGAYSKAVRVSPTASSALNTAKLDEAAYVAGLDPAAVDAPPTRAASVRAELDAAQLRLGTMRSMLAPDAEERASLDAFEAAFLEGAEALERGDDEAALEALGRAKTESRAIRKALKPLDPARADRGGVGLVARQSQPLYESIAAWEVFLMALWIAVATWPVWNLLVNGVLLRGNRYRVRAARRWKLVAVLLLSLVSAFAWRAHFGPVAAFDSSDWKGGITDGSIVLLETGRSTADLVAASDGAPAAGNAAPGDAADLVVWAPIPYGYAELHEDEKFRAPTWTARAELDPETGRSVLALASESAVEGGSAAGVSAESNPVEIRAGELPLNHPWRHALGTDESGRDILTRMIWGARISLSVGILSAALLTLIGVVIGSIAGFFGGRVDDLIMRGIEILQTIPALFLILLALAFTPPGTIPPMFAVVIVIAVVRWTGVARLVRGEFMRLRDAEFVVAARALGFSSRRTIFRHVLPNAMSPVLVAAAFAVASGILTESAVSFLGLGIKEPQASWGGVVNESRNVDLWWIQVFPGLAIFLTVTCYNLVGDAIRDAMDPKARV